MSGNKRQCQTKNRHQTELWDTKRSSANPFHLHLHFILRRHGNPFFYMLLAIPKHLSELKMNPKGKAPASQLLHTHSDSPYPMWSGAVKSVKLGRAVIMTFCKVFFAAFLGEFSILRCKVVLSCPHMITQCYSAQAKEMKEEVPWLWIFSSQFLACPQHFRRKAVEHMGLKDLETLP